MRLIAAKHSAKFDIEWLVGWLKALPSSDEGSAELCYDVEVDVLSLELPNGISLSVVNASEAVEVMVTTRADQEGWESDSTVLLVNDQLRKRFKFVFLGNEVDPQEALFTVSEPAKNLKVTFLGDQNSGPIVSSPSFREMVYAKYRVRT